MSLPDYFTQPEDPTFPGEMPLPEPVGFSDPGMSAQKANADHAHELNIGSNQTPWFDLLLTPPWQWYGLPYRKPQYTRVGNLAIMRGVFWSATNVTSPSELGKIPVEYSPTSGNREQFSTNGTPIAGGYYPIQVDIRDTGQVFFSAGGTVNVISLGYLIYVVD